MLIDLKFRVRFKRVKYPCPNVNFLIFFQFRSTQCSQLNNSPYFPVTPCEFCKLAVRFLSLLICC